MGILKQEVEEVALSERTMWAALQTIAKCSFRLLTNRSDREMCIAASLGCVAAAVSEHGPNHKLMNDSSRGLA